MSTNYYTDRFYQKSLLFLPLYLLTFLLPFLPILSEAFPIKILERYTLLGFLKEIIVLIFVFTSFLVWIKSNSFLKINGIILFLLLFFIYGFFHMIMTSANFLNAINNFRLVFIYLLLCIFIIIVTKAKKALPHPDIFLGITLFSSILVAFFGLYEKFVNPEVVNFYKINYASVVKNLGIPGFPRVRIASTLGNPINLGLFLNIGILSALYFLEVSKKSITKLISLLSIPLFVIIILFTLSRVAYLSLFILFSFYFLYKILSLKRASKRIIFIGLFLLLIGALYLTIHKIDLFRLRTAQILEQSSLSEEPRFEKWSYIWEVLSDNIFIFLYGKGLGNSGTSGLKGEYIIIENTYLSILYELGVFGLLFFIITVLCFLINVINLYFNNQGDKKIRTFAIISLIYLVVFLFGGVFTDTYINNPFNYYFWLYFAFALSFKSLTSYATKKFELQRASS